MPEKPLFVDLVKIVVERNQVHLDFRDAHERDHRKSYVHTAFIAAVQKLADRAFTARVIGLELLGMYKPSGQRVFRLAFDDGTVGLMGVPSDHGPANDLELLLHPQSGRNRQLLAVLQSQRTAGFTMDNPYRNR